MFKASVPEAKPTVVASVPEAKPTVVASVPEAKPTVVASVPEAKPTVPDTAPKIGQPPSLIQAECIQRINNHLKPRNLSVSILVKNEVQGVVDGLTESEKAALKITEFPALDLTGRALSEDNFTEIKNYSIADFYFWFAKRGKEMRGLKWTNGEQETIIINKAAEILKFVWTECQSNHNTAPEWLAVKAKWPKALVFFDGERRPSSYAMYTPLGGQVTWIIIGFQEKIETDWVVLGEDIPYLIAHELAHIAHPSHNEVWRTVSLFMCNVIAKQYTVPIMNNRCTYYAMCDKQLCPRCKWEFDDPNDPQGKTACEISEVKDALDNLGGGSQVWPPAYYA